MFLWITALLLVAALGVIGFYQGALRVSFSLVGLLLGAVLAKPIGTIFYFILPALGIAHPAILAFVAPVLGFIVVLGTFKGVALALHKKIDTWYKYKGSDTQRLLWERLNSRVGIALGLANAYVYLILLSSLFYSMGYFTYQMATDREEHWTVKALNRLAKDVHTTGMVKSIAPFNPMTETYMDGADVLADLFHSPLLQNRLANYPLFLTLGEKQEFKDFADPKFQEQWASGMSLREFASHEKVKPLIENQELYTNVLAMVRPDLKDLKAYLETGTSAKYDEEKILGRWELNFRGSISEARRRKPTIGTAELTALRRILAAAFRNAQVTATVDNQIILRLPEAPDKKVSHGAWKGAGGGQYILTISRGEEKDTEVQAYVDGKKMTVEMAFGRQKVYLVFENTRV